jgi:uncharacterized protein (DUF427 family)
MTVTNTTEIKVERSPKRIRVLLGGELVADTTAALLVWENPHYPFYYIPASDVRAELIPAGTETKPGLGEAELFDVKVASTTAERAARRYPDSPAEQLRDAIRFEWAAMGEWLEEDEPVYKHARSPYTRVDILASSRHVRVEVDGVTVADSHSPRMLFETGLPARYYLPLGDIRMDLLRPSTSQTVCPYKGTASYWSLDTGKGLHEDVVWTYRAPLPESQKIAGLGCFYNEKVDIYIDGVLQERPSTPFS